MLASGHSCGQAGVMKNNGEAWPRELMVSTAEKPGCGSLLGQERGDHTGQHFQRLSLDIRAALPPECLDTCGSH